MYLLWLREHALRWELSSDLLTKNIKRWAIEACRPDEPWAMSCKTNRKKGKSYLLTERNFWPHGATFICASRHDGFVISLWSFLSWPLCGIQWLIDASWACWGTSSESQSLRCNTYWLDTNLGVWDETRMRCSCLHCFKLNQIAVRTFQT